MRPCVVCVRVLIVAAAVCPPTLLLGQEWRLSTEAGRIRSALDPAAAAPTISLGLRYEDPATGLRFSAGVPTNSDEALWGGIGAFKRLSIRGGAFLAGVDLLGNAFGLVDRAPGPISIPGPLDPPTAPDAQRNGHALAGQVLPVVGFEGARLQVLAHAGVSRYASRIAGLSRDRSVSVTDLQVTYTAASSFAVSPILQRVQGAAESASTFAGVSVLAASSSGSVWAMLGRWSPDSVADVQWGAGGRLRLHPLVSLEAMARHSAFDPLYLQPAQTSWSLGLSVLLGRSRVVSPPVPAAYSGGRALIRLPVSESKTAPSIAGDFNAWKPAPMRRDGTQWTYTVAVAPGVYHYAFVNSDGEWFVPKSVAGRKDDGMGGHVAVLVVR